MIVGCRLIPYELPFTEVVPEASRGRGSYRRGILLGVASAAGRTGWGEAAPLPGWSSETLPQVAAALGELVETVSRSPRPVRELRARVASWIADLPSAAAALDGALLDVEAQEAGVPIAGLLAHGPAARSVAVNALIGGATPRLVAEQAVAACAAGYATLKLKVGSASPDADVARIRAVRDAVGSGVALRIDAESAWDVDTAADLLRRVEPLDLEFVEDPVGDLDSLAALAPRVTVPLAADGLLARSGDPVHAVDWASAALFVLKPSALGGLTLAARLAAVAAGRGCGVVVTSFFESAVGLTGAAHLAASLPDGSPACGLATGHVLAGDVAEAPVIRDGLLFVPEGPGLGVTPEILQRDGRRGGPAADERSRNE